MIRVLVFLALLSPAVVLAAERPNVVVLLADDLGYRDIGCYGGPVRTPALDSLAEQGTRFSDFYSGCAVCSPSRATLLTGRHHIRTGVYSWIHDPSQRSHLLEREVTLAEVLQQQGYATAHVGKWHLGLPTEQRDKPTPDQHGFDYWFATWNNASPSHRNPTNFLRNGQPVGPLEGYSCQLVVDEAIRWLEEDRDPDTPFYLNVWFHEPHAPIAAPEEIVKQYGKPGDKGAVYSGTIHNTDLAVARLLARLREVDAPENTLIIYASDNGSYRADRTGNLRGAKGQNWEGGIRVPGIFCWPGRISAGSVRGEPAGVVDILPTVCGLLGIDTPAGVHLDGSNLAPLLTGKPDTFQRHQPLFWHLQKSRPIVAMRDGNYSLVADPDYELSTSNMFQEEWIPRIKSGTYTRFRLFDLERDPGQQQDLAAEQPQVLQRLKQELLKINDSIMREAHDWHLEAGQASAASSSTHTFRAGAARVDITPEPGVSLDGPISKNGPVTGVHDRLHARALVLDDGRTELAIVICDACMIGRDVFDAAKRMVREETGMPAERMLLAATHTHAAVRAVHIGNEPRDDEYHRRLARWIADSIVQARKNLGPARMAYAAFDKPDLIRCRRFLCEPGSVGVNPFGEPGERIKSVAGKSSAVIEPAGPVDPQFSVLSIQHADGKPLAILGNFSVHYCGGYRRGLVSADYFGHYAAALESQLDAGSGRPPFVGIMSNGTSGNTGAIERAGVAYEPFEWMQVSARMLASETLEALRDVEHRRDVTLDMATSELTLAVRRPDEKRVEWARNLLADASAPTPHRWSRVYAQEALHLSEYPATVDVPLQAIRIGEVAIAAAPCEVFAETGLAIKKASPHRHTFTIELANGYGGYLPPREQHELGGYETWPARSSFLEVDAEAKIRSELSRLLQQVMRANVKER